MLERDLSEGLGFFRLHDIVRQFLREGAGTDGLAAQHRALVAALDGAADAGADERTRRYFYRSLPYHLAEAGERERLNALLLDPAWLKAKLETTGNPSGLFLDYQQYGAGEAQSLIGRALRLTSGILARDGRQLPVQLADQLTGIETPGLASFVERAWSLITRPAIVLRRPSLSPPGAEIARLEGHTDWVRALCLLPDGRLASGSDDNTIRLWNATTGARQPASKGMRILLRRFACCRMGGSPRAPMTIRSGCGMQRPAPRQPASKGIRILRRALCLLPDGRLASGSDDNTIRLWNVAAGAETARLEGHSGPVLALCLLPDEGLASGSSDNTIRLWNVAAGAEIARLEGHTDWVQALCLLPDGRLASGSDDKTIRLWSATTGAETARLEGHRILVEALCLLPDGRLASGSDDKTIRLWNVTTGAETARLEGHSSGVDALCVLPNGRLASGSGDKTIRLWNVKTGAESARLEGHAELGFRRCACC